MTFRQYLLNGWQTPNLLCYLLWPLSLLYRCLMWLRVQCYTHGLLKTYRSPVPVIVVGNISVGGTGKTPLVIYLIEQLQAHGYKPGVISRGYGGTATHYPLHVKADTDPSESGDEPALIVKCTAAPMVVGADRQASIKLLLSESDCDVVISDDGLQHYALQRDIEVCILDATTQSNNHFLLPSGPWREPKNRLKNVDFVLHHTTDAKTTNKPAQSNISSGRAIHHRMHLQAQAPLRVDGQPPTQILAKKVNAVAGIGNPVRFFNTCKTLGFDIIERTFADHHQYQAEDLQFVDDLPVLMTEKDAIKCVKFADAKHWYLPVQAQLSDGFIKALINKLKSVAI